MPRTARPVRRTQPPRPLTPKQEAFCRAYLENGRNATAAYRIAYHAGRMSDGAARVAACRLLKDRRITARCAAVVVAVEKETEISVAWTLQRLREEADRDGEDASHAARVSALKAIGHHLGMFPRETRLTGPGGGPIGVSNETPILTHEERAHRLRHIFEQAAAARAVSSSDDDASGA